MVREDDVARLIRARRRQLGWSLAKVSAAAKIASPAYVFHIENGQKVPSEAVASRLASALGLDPGLLEAWVRARGRNDLATSLEAAAVISRWLGRVAEAPPGEAIVHVPILPEGADPTRRDATSDLAIETLALDRRLFPPLTGPPRLIGYRLSAHGARRVADLVHPGDCVIVLLGGDPPPFDAPCAVRIGARVEIARVRPHGGAVHLPSLGDAHDSGGEGERIADAGVALVGRVILVFRRWL